MRILVNRGGQQLGPFSLEELRTAIATGQVSQQDLAWWEGAPSWVNVSQVPGLSSAGAGLSPGTPTLAVSGNDTGSGLAISSLVLGILSLLGLSCLSGIPAIICGHMAQSRRKEAGVGSSGIAVAGLVTGYAGTVLTVLVILLAAIAVPSFVRARQKAQLTQSMQKAKQIATACFLYQAEHNGEYPDSLDDLPDPTIKFVTDPLSPGKYGSEAFWYSKPSRTAPNSTVIVAGYGTTSDGQRALGHKDGSASTGSFTIPNRKGGTPLEPLTVPPRR